MGSTDTGCGWNVAYRLRFAEPWPRGSREACAAGGLSVGGRERGLTQKRGTAGRKGRWGGRWGSRCRDTR